MRKVFFLPVIALCFAVFSFGADKIAGAAGDFSFVQMSDTHWGFNKPEINPDFAGTLKKAVAEVNALDPKPDFVVFTGDLTHSTADKAERKKRLLEFKEITKTLNVKNIKYLPGEHDAGMDRGEVYKEVLGKTYYAFDHKGVHFIVLDNVSAPDSTIGEKQLLWLKTTLGKLDRSSRIVVFTHRPLFELSAQWDWWTKDGDRAIDLLKPFKNVTVFYGHIHNENTHITEQIVFHAAKSLMYRLTWLGTAEHKAPVPWDADMPYAGLGFRTVGITKDKPECIVTEYPINSNEGIPAALTEPVAQVCKIQAGDFFFRPDEIRVKMGSPVSIELTSLDELHSFYCHDLGIRSDIVPGEVKVVRFTPMKEGTYVFNDDLFVGEGYDDMVGKIVVEK